MASDLASEHSTKNTTSTLTPSDSSGHARKAASRKVAIALAFTGALPTPLPLAWLHKFYLGQYLWGVVYLILAPTLLPQVACCLEGIWYLVQSDDAFHARFSTASVLSSHNASEKTERTIENARPTVSETAIAIRELEQLRQEGLITEYEFEQKRRKFLDQV